LPGETVIPISDILSAFQCYFTCWSTFDVHWYCCDSCALEAC